MSLFYISFGIAALSSALYHLFQKSISPSVNPVISLMVTYVTALCLSALLLLVFPSREGLVDSLRRVNWASSALAIAIVGLEAGFLLAYRAGWNVSVTSVASTSAAALLLVPAGMMLFKEKPSLVNIVGVFVCIIGLVMVNLRK